MVKKIKTNITINGPGKNIFKASVVTDESLLKLIKAGEISGTPISLQGKQIENVEINNTPLKGSHKLIIGNTHTYFNITVGENIYNNIPFNRKKISEDTVLFKTNSPDIPVKIKIKLKFIKNVGVNVKLTIGALSDNIKDLLCYEKIKKEWYNKPFNMKIDNIDETIVSGVFDFIEYNDILITFYEKVNYINQKLNLDLKHSSNYALTDDDFISLDYICNYLKYKKIPFKTYKINMKITHEKLEHILMSERKNCYLTSEFSTILLNNNIELGKYKIEISEVIYLNYKDLLDVYHKNQKENKDVDIELIIRSIKPEENYLIF